jgi:SAM-dependent methyltransferase
MDQDKDFELRFDMMRRLMTPLWLRPESALWYAHMLYEARQLLDGCWQGPVLEFGSMDGINTAILLGAEFDETFDVYEEVVWSKDSHRRSTLNDDYFAVLGTGHKELSFKTLSQGNVDVGVDWKEAHIEKSRRLNIFKELVLIDRADVSLPFEEKSFQTIWAPNIYWIEDVDRVLKELFRVLKPGGRLVTIGPDIQQLDFMVCHYATGADAQWLQDLDRGRYQNTRRQARSLQAWEDLFNSKGFRLEKHKMFIPTVVGKTYDIGFRPMFPVFMNMYEKLKAASTTGLLDVKRHWIETCLHFARPLCNTAWMEDMPRGWHIFELGR